MHTARRRQANRNHLPGRRDREYEIVAGPLSPRARVSGRVMMVSSPVPSITVTVEVSLNPNNPYLDSKHQQRKCMLVSILLVHPSIALIQTQMEWSFLLTIGDQTYEQASLSCSKQGKASWRVTLAPHAHPLSFTTQGFFGTTYASSLASIVTTHVELGPMDSGAPSGSSVRLKLCANSGTSSSIG